MVTRNDLQAKIIETQKGSNIKYSFDLAYISFINRSDTAASSTQQGWNLTALYDTQ